MRAPWLLRHLVPGALLLLCASSLLAQSSAPSAVSPGSAPGPAAPPSRASSPPPLLAAPPSAAEEDAWNKLTAQPATLNPPADWKKNPPSEETVQKWMGPESERLMKVADEAQAFAARFPGSPNAGVAREGASQALFSAMKLGHPQAAARLRELDKERLADSALSPQDRLAIRVRQVQMQATSLLSNAQAEAEKAGTAGQAATAAQARLAQVEAAAKAQFIAGARQLMKEFPGQPEPYALLLEVAGEGENDESRGLLQEVADAEAAPAGVRQRARGVLRRADNLGKPLDLQFTALDGRSVNLQAMTGKVVLIDFWATWCGPCITALPGVKKTYEDLRQANFEIIGISFDKDRAKLEQFIKEKGMNWPQYFDGKYMDNEYGRKFGIESVPTMWLVDKQGILRDVHADVNLREKVTKLLEEEAAAAAKP